MIATRAVGRPAFKRRASAFALALIAAMPFALRASADETANGDAGVDARIYFIAGFASAFDNLDKLTALFALSGVPTSTYPPAFWHAVVRDATRAYRASGGQTDIVLVGHSLGAIHVYEVAQALERRGIPVALIIGFDPTREAEVTGNVAVALNFFLTPDVEPVVAAPDFAGTLTNEIVGDIAVLPHHDIIYDETLRQRALGAIRRAIE